MLVRNGNIWETAASYVVLPINTTLKSGGFGDLVMGAGLAKQVKQMYPSAPKRYGDLLRIHGNHVLLDKPTRIILFPTKHDYRKPSTLELVEQSLKELVTLRSVLREDVIIALPAVGCGCGNLKWTDVEPLMHKYLEEDCYVCVLLNNGTNLHKKNTGEQRRNS